MRNRDSAGKTHLLPVDLGVESESAHEIREAHLVQNGCELLPAHEIGDLGGVRELVLESAEHVVPGVCVCVCVCV
jgi:hypothetical protein